MPVPTELLNLIERFKRNLDQYKQKQYNETQVRVDYIDPDTASLQRRVEATDRLVYELYELSEEEIAVVEGRTH